MLLEPKDLDAMEQAIAHQRQQTGQAVPLALLPAVVLTTILACRARHIEGAGKAGVRSPLVGQDMDHRALTLQACHLLVHENRARFIQPSDDPLTWSIEPFQFKHRHEAIPEHLHTQHFHPDPKSRGDDRPWIAEAMKRAPEPIWAEGTQPPEQQADSSYQTSK